MAIFGGLAPEVPPATKKEFQLSKQDSSVGNVLAWYADSGKVRGLNPARDSSQEVGGY